MIHLNRPMHFLLEFSPRLWRHTNMKQFSVSSGISRRRFIAAAGLAVVLGAGVLGMEAACGLARRGVAVTVVHPMAALMERQLDGDLQPCHGLHLLTAS